MVIVYSFLLNYVAALIDEGNRSQANVYLIVGALVGSIFLIAVVVVVTIVLLKRRLN